MAIDSAAEDTRAIAWYGELTPAEKRTFWACFGGAAPLKGKLKGWAWCTWKPCGWGAPAWSATPMPVLSAP